jgi:1-phosphofructokinase
MSGFAQVLTVTPNPAIDQTLEIAAFAAGRVNRVLSSRSDAGGKGVNVATILGELDVPVLVTGFLGEQNAKIFEQHFAAHKLQDRFLRVPGATRTGIKIIDTESRETTDINFPGVQVALEDASKLLGAVEELSDKGSWHVLSGSLPVGLEPDFYRGLIEAIHAKGGQVLLDTSSLPLRHAVAARPEILKPNLAELEELLDTPVRSVEQARAAAGELLTGSTRLVVVSMGGDGALFVTREVALVAQPPRVNVVSTVGAGDAMVAGIVWSLLQGMDLQETARWSTAFGAYAVTRCGAGVERQTVQTLKEQVKVSSLESNVEDRRESAAQGV